MRGFRKDLWDHSEKYLPHYPRIIDSEGLEVNFSGYLKMSGRCVSHALTSEEVF